MTTALEFTETELRVAAGTARRIHRNHRGLVDYDDIRSECFVWMCANPRKVETWRDEGKVGKAKLGTALYRAGQRFAIRERATITRTKTGDHALYSEVLVEELLPDALDYDGWVLESHSTGETRGPSRPGEGNTRLAMLIDVKSAYESLPDADQKLLAQRFANGGIDVVVLATWHEVSESTMRRRIRAGLRKMVNTLGGEPWT